mgnify:CR=1 FL=1
MRKLLLVFALLPLSLLADTYYWVGGAGNWSDINHWVTASGGNVYHTQLPGSNDDVFFDANSGFSSNDSVLFTVQTNYCNDLNINVPGQIPTFFGALSNILRVYGSIDMSTPVHWEVRGTLYLESTSTETLAITDTLKSVFFNTSGVWNITDSIVANKVILDNGTLNLNNSAYFQCDTFEVKSGTTLNATNVLFKFGYSQIDQNATFSPTNIDIQLQRPLNTWSNPYFRYYPSDSIHINTIKTTQGSSQVYLNNVSVDTIYGSNSVNLTAYDSEIIFFDAGYPNIELTRSYTSSPIDANYLNVRLFDNSQVPSIKSNSWAYVCLQNNSATDSVIVNGNLEIGGQNNTKVPLVRSETLDVRYVCAGGTLNLGNVFTQGNITMSIPANIDTLNMGYPATMILNHSGTSQITYLKSLAPCDSTNRIESKTSFASKTLDISDGNITNTHFRDVINNNQSGLTISSGNLMRTAGFTSNNSNGATYYWVGGSGNWSDVSHWATISGGTTSVGCIPTLLDTVVIDDNSGSSNFTIQLSDFTEIAAFLDQTSQLEPTLNSPWAAIFRASNRFHNKNCSFYNGMFVSLEGSYQNSTLKSRKKIGRLVLGTTGKWTQIDSVRCDRFHFFKGVYDQNEYPLYVDDRMSNNRDEHDSYVVGNVNWDIENTEAYIRQLNFSSGGNYITNVSGSTVYLNNWQEHYINDSLNLNRVISNGNGGEFYLAGSIWNVQSLTNFNDLELRWGDTRLNSDTLILQCPATVSSNSYLSNEYRIGYFFPNSDCGNRLTMEGNFDWEPTVGPHTIPFANFSGINVTQDSIIAISSTDLGGNTNVIFTPDQTRTLYWVNDGGSWNDSIHWSLTSGGIGGECLPTPIDSVVFDDNSFVNSHSVNINNTNAFAHDIIIDSAGWASFNGNKSMLFYGSLIVHDSIYVNPWDNDWIGETNNLDSIYLNAGRLGDFSLKGSNWIVPTDITIANQFRNYADSTYLDSGIIFNNLSNSIYNYGDLYSQNNTFSGSNLYNYGHWFDTNSVIDLSSTFYSSGTTFNSGTYVTCYYLSLNGNDSILNGFYESDYQIEIGNTTYLKNDSLISHREYRIGGTYSDTNTFHYLNHDSYLNPQWGDYARFYMQSNDSIGNFRFEGINQAYYYHTGSGSIQTLHLMDNTLLYDNPEADSLYLYAGNTYEIESGKTLEINEYLNAFGTFCDYIYIRSDDQGTRSYINSDFQIFTNFCEYRDIEYAGSSTYFAGDQSTDQGNNYNLLWDNIAGYIWGFPSDTLAFFCNDTSVYSEFVLGTETFQNALNFLWDDGSDSTHRVITQSGLYSVTAFYATCTYTDSIQVNFVYKPEVDATQFSVCKGSNISVFSQTPDGINVEWSNGSTQDTSNYIVNSDTSIVVNWLRGGNILCSDTLIIEGVSIDAITTSAADPLCADSQDGQIDITGITGGHGPFNHSWSHSSTLNGTSATNLIDGCYFITTTDTLGCARVDTVCLIAPPPLSATYSLTQPFCEGDPGAAVVGANGGTPAYSYTYNFNPTSIPSGNYTFTVTDTNGCTADTNFTIAHTFNFDYTVDIDTATCGENNGAVQIMPSNPNNAYTYSWSAYPGYGNNGQIFMPVSNGFIYIQDSVAGCIDTVYYEIPAGGVTNAIFLTSQDSGVSPLTVSTTNIAAAPGLQYTWMINGDTVSFAQDTSFTFGGYGDYLITLCVYDPVFGCQFCSEKWIKVLPNPEFDAPNFFTPNFDGINDYFELVIGQDLEWLEVEIFNRWDQLVFRSNEVDFQWDGRAMNGRACASGVYFWVIRYTEVGNPQVIPAQGTVHLID